MSSNDIIYLSKVDKKYIITHNNADDGYELDRVVAKTAEEALLKAEAMQDSVAPEYGIMVNISPLPKEL